MFYIIGLPEHGDVDPGGGAAEAGVEDVGGHGVRVTPRHLGPGPGAWHGGTHLGELLGVAAGVNLQHGF